MKKTLLQGLATLALVPLFGFAVVSATTSTSTTPRPSFDIACVQGAIEKRETTLIATHNTYNTAVVNALTARKDALKQAWAKPTHKEQKAARKEAWLSFRKAHKAAHEGLRLTRKTTWSSFDSDMRACGVRNHGEKPSQVENPTSSL